MADITGELAGVVTTPVVDFDIRKFDKPHGVLSARGILSCVPDPKLPNIVHLPVTRDIVFQRRRLDEVAKLHYPKVSILRLDRDKTFVNQLYRESDTRRFHEPVEILAFVEHSPSKKSLSKFGIDKRREVVFSVPVNVLDEANLLDLRATAYIGDLVQWDGTLFEVMNQARPKEGYWLNTNIPLYIMLFCDFYQPEV